VKYDRQIVAVAKVCGATTIYSDDKDVRTLAKTVKIEVIGLADLPLPPDKGADGPRAKRVLPKAAPHHPWGLFIKKAREIEADVKAVRSGRIARATP
jgi:hypothetical protein